LRVPVSTHYARGSRKTSRRELVDRQLLAEIGAARSGRRRVYGARRTWKELRRRDVEVGRDQVARVMREHGLVGKPRGSKKRTTIPEEAAVARARDFLQRDFTAIRPNEKVGRRPDLHPQLERLRLPRLHPRLLQPPDRRLAARETHARRACARRARDGQRAAPTTGGPDRHSDRGPANIRV
jgi:transposase InsO family protein